MNLHVYIHAASMGDHWREIVAELIGMIDGSGLYDASSSLRCVVVGGGETRYLASRGLPKWETIEYGGSIHEYEYPTLRLLWEHARREPDGYYLYMHSKGASSYREGSHGAYAGKRFRDRWRKIMSYYLVTRWRERVEELANADAVGCFPIGGPLPHYSGNFWWARGDHVTKLAEPAPQHPFQPGGEHPRLWAELWLQSIPGRFTTCYNHPTSIDQEFTSGVYREALGCSVGDSDSVGVRGKAGV